jgi:hypothetical protein
MAVNPKEPEVVTYKDTLGNDWGADLWAYPEDVKSVGFTSRGAGKSAIEANARGLAAKLGEAKARFDEDAIKSMIKMAFDAGQQAPDAKRLEQENTGLRQQVDRLMDMVNAANRMLDEQKVSTAMKMAEAEGLRQRVDEKQHQIEMLMDELRRVTRRREPVREASVQITHEPLVFKPDWFKEKEPPF